MNYNTLKEICVKRNTTISAVASAIGLTYSGLKKSLMNESLGMKYILPLCEQVGISPNQLLGYKKNDTSYTTQVQNGGIGNKQIYGDDISILHKQLEIKDTQIAELISIIKNK